MSKKKKILLLIHPLLFAIFPVLFLFSHNVDKVATPTILRALVFSLVGVGLLIIGLGFVISDFEKRSIIISFFLLTFFSYGHVTSILPDLDFSTQLGIVIYRDSYALAGWLVFVAFVIVAVVRSPRIFSNINSLLNIVATVLVFISLTRISVFYITSNNSGDLSKTPPEKEKVLKNTRELGIDEQIVDRLDIYYIILDGHARVDILDELYNYDGSEFITELEEMGFFVAKKGVSNYPQTYFSIASALNMEYVNYLTDIVGEDHTSREPLRNLINNNRVYEKLENIGYKLITFDSGWSGTESINKTDVYVQEGFRLSEFENVLIGVTPLAVMGGEHIQYKTHRERIQYALEHLADITEIEGPTFTYIHIFSPHPPFVFDKNGERVKQKVKFGTNDPSWKFLYGRSSTDYILAYADQLSYIDKKIIVALKNVLARSENPPIIILQSDHGPAAFFHYNKPDLRALKERLSILNAYYFPQNGNEALYSSITPINTFRLIFNLYFGADYKLLEDKAYYSTWSEPYRLIDISEKVGLGG